ncbi:MAG TPA: hypothetical protein VJQ57_15785, partial [Acidimicrobiia bacterium]|nr:hypothetical protein [Acidimicrobiia bacterium]
TSPLLELVPGSSVVVVEDEVEVTSMVVGDELEVVDEAVEASGVVTVSAVSGGVPHETTTMARTTVNGRITGEDRLLSPCSESRFYATEQYALRMTAAEG